MSKNKSEGPSVGEISLMIRELIKAQRTSPTNIIEALRDNKYGWDIGKYNQALRSISVHYHVFDDFLMAAGHAWLATHVPALKKMMTKRSKKKGEGA